VREGEKEQGQEVKRRAASVATRHPAPEFVGWGNHEPGSRRPWLVAPLVLALATTLLALSASVASAASLHAFSQSFGAPGSGAGQLSLAAQSGVAVNSTSHDVYVADTENHRIAEFSAAGSFIRAFGWGVADGSTAAAQTCTLTCFAGLSGSGSGQFEAPTFLAVDNDISSSSHGDLYVADSEDRLVTKFDATGNVLASWGDHLSPAETPEPNGQLSGREAPGGPFLNEFGSSIAGIAVDAEGDLWVYTTASHMLEFDQAGSFLREWGGPGARPVGIGLTQAPTVYLDSGFEQIEALTVEGSPLGAVTPMPSEASGVQPPLGLAVDQAHGDVYVDLGDQVAHYPRGCVSGSCSAEETFGAAQLSAAGGLDVDAANSSVYVADHGSGQLHAFNQVLGAETGPASGIGADTATLRGTVEPGASPLTSCEFEYGEGEEFESSVPCEAALPITGSTPVEATLGGLKGSTTYRYRLAVASAAGTLRAEEETFTTASTPGISNLAASELTASAAKLSARVNPGGMALSGCQFEFGPSASYGQSVPCEQSPAQIGSGFSSVAVSAAISGLLPSTTYHWRLVVANANGSARSDDQTFTYSTAAGLPDGRRYELVTPARKNGALIGKLFATIPPQISADGSRVIAATVQCFGAAPSCVGNRQNEGAPYAFERSPGGWSARSITPPATAYPTYSYWTLNANGPTALFSVPESPLEQDDFYAGEADGSFAPIGPLGDSFEAGSFMNLTKEGLTATADLSHLVFETVVPAWAFDATESTGTGLYEYAGRGGSSPLLVGVSGGQGSTNLISICGSFIGNREQSFGKHNRPLSTDGRVVYFTASRCGSGSGTNAGIEVPADALYARIDGERSGAHSVKISEPSAGVCTTPACLANTSPANQASRARSAAFEGASDDGSQVSFTDTQQLTDTASQDPATGDAPGIGCEQTTDEGSGCNLYLSSCSVPCAQPGSERELIDVSATLSGGPRVQRLVAISPDGSHLYFVAKGVLTTAANQFGQRAHPGAQNLYVYARDSAVPQGRVSFLAALSRVDAAQSDANVSADGQRLLFLSHRGLTPDARAQGPAQVYEYDDRAGSLTRISVGQGGYNNNGNDAEGDAGITGVFATVANSVPLRSDPSMSSDGSFIYFSSPAALVPGALDNVQVGLLNGVEPIYAQNIYEYHEGRVSLISDGADASVGSGFPPNGVELLGTDTSGDNVFFSTAQPLVPEDTDTQLDIYDAHRCTAPQPCTAPTSVPQAPCEGDSCRGAGSSAGVVAAAGSAEFSGPGNPRPKPRKHNSKGKCKKAKQAGHGKCVKQKKQKKAGSDRRAGR
jgi:hypothetical protein